MRRTIRQLWKQIERCPSWITLVVTAAGFWVLACWLPQHYFGKGLAHFRPTNNWDDEIMYWQSAWSFMHHAFNTGYFGINEAPAAWEFTPQGVHGPFYSVLLGWTAWLFQPFGHEFFPPGVNLAWLIASLGFFWWMVRPEGSCLLALLLLTFWPLHLYLPSSGQEVLNQCFGLIGAALLFQLWKKPTANNRLLLVTVAAFGAFALIRVSWGLLFIPIIAMTPAPKKLLPAVVRIGIAVGLLLVFMWAWQKMVSPFPKDVTAYQCFKIIMGEESPMKLWNFFMDNLKRALDLNCALHSKMCMLEFLLRMQIGLICTCWIVWLWKGRQSFKESPEKVLRPGLFHLFNLGVPAFLILLAYFIGNLADYRAMACHLLLSLGLLIASNEKRQQRLAAAILLVNLLSIPLFSYTYRQFRGPNFQYDQGLVEEFKINAVPKIPFNPKASRWCNTLLGLHTAPPNLHTLSTLPSGLGLDFVLNIKYLPLPPKSQYILADTQRLKELYPTSNVRVQPSPNTTKVDLHIDEKIITLIPLQETPSGTLYRNATVDCIND